MPQILGISNADTFYSMFLSYNSLILSLGDHLHDGGGNTHDLQILISPLKQAVLGHSQLLTNSRLLAVCEAVICNNLNNQVLLEEDSMWVMQYMIVTLVD